MSTEKKSSNKGERQIVIDSNLAVWVRREDVPITSIEGLSKYAKKGYVKRQGSLYLLHHIPLIIRCDNKYQALNTDELGKCIKKIDFSLEDSIMSEVITKKNPAELIEVVETVIGIIEPARRGEKFEQFVETVVSDSKKRALICKYIFGHEGKAISFTEISVLTNGRLKRSTFYRIREKLEKKKKNKKSEAPVADEHLKEKEKEKSTEISTDHSNESKIVEIARKPDVKNSTRKKIEEEIEGLEIGRDKENDVDEERKELPIGLFDVELHPLVQVYYEMAKDNGVDVKKVNDLLKATMDLDDNNTNSKNRDDKNMDNKKTYIQKYLEYVTGNKNEFLKKLENTQKHLVKNYGFKVE